MDLKTIIVAALLIGLAGCSHGTLGEIASRRGEALEATSNDELAGAYAHTKSTFGASRTLRTEMERRSMFSGEEWARIDAGKVRVGDSESLVWAAWGTPEEISDFLTDKGRSRVLTYELKGRRVYVDNGIVTGIGSGR